MGVIKAKYTDGDVTLTWSDDNTDSGYIAGSELSEAPAPAPGKVWWVESAPAGGAPTGPYTKLQIEGYISKKVINSTRKLCNTDHDKDIWAEANRWSNFKDAFQQAAAATATTAVQDARQAQHARVQQLASVQAPSFAVNELVERRNVGKPWGYGRVKQTSPLKVTKSPLGDGDGESWDEVRKNDYFPAGLEVERRHTGDKKWRKGHVEDESNPHLDEFGHTWDEVRKYAPSVYLSAPAAVKRMVDNPIEYGLVTTASIAIGVPGVSKLYYGIKEGKSPTKPLASVGAAVLGDALSEFMEEQPGEEVGLEEYIDTKRSAQPDPTSMGRNTRRGEANSRSANTSLKFTTYAEGWYKLFGNGTTATRTDESRWKPNVSARTAATDPLPSGGRHFAEFELLSGVTEDGATSANAGFFIGLIAADADVQAKDHQEKRGNCFLDAFSGRRFQKDTGGTMLGEKWKGTPSRGQLAFNSDRIGLLFDSDAGRLSVFKNGEWLGVMMPRGLTGKFRWAVALYRRGTSVRIEAKSAPPKDVREDEDSSSDDCLIM
eukprot:COSAG06_NODE_1905_length_8095_cov_10.218984_9_plen_546_part_00